jgi:eukaryotic-like serine/threonine-protein kinase
MATLTGGEFVGRQREMDSLKAALEDTISGQGRLIMLVGEPGVGKTRTAQELGAYANVLGAQVLWGWCYEEAGAPPYWPWVQPIRSYVQQCDPQQIRIDMGLGAADIAEIIPEIRHKLSDLEPSPDLEPEQARFHLFDSITTFLKNASQTQPLMLVLDDLHWADRSSLLLLEFIAHDITDS